MWKRIQHLKLFEYNGPNIRNYCKKHLNFDYETFYRIFYYDTAPYDGRGHNPVSKKSVNFTTSPAAQKQNLLFDSIKKTPNFALRLGHVIWDNNRWALKPEPQKSLLNGTITVSDLKEDDVAPIFKQKAVDMKIGLDIAYIAMKKLADKLVIITGDADMVPALKAARREGMQVALDPLGQNIGPELSEHIDYLVTKTNDREYKKTEI